MLATSAGPLAPSVVASANHAAEGTATPLDAPGAPPAGSATPAMGAPASVSPEPTATPRPSSPVPSPTVAPLVIAVGPNGAPRFSDVASRTPAEVIAYLQGRLPGYPGSGPSALLGFSPSDILETMDTLVLDTVGVRRGAAALQQVYAVIGRAVLDTLRQQYPDGWVLVALDAGHGGKPGVDWDPGSEGTEATHTRGVVAAIERLSAEPAYQRIITRRIFNDAIAADFGLPRSLNRPTVNQTLLRQARASMLAFEAAAWNQAHRSASAQVVVHEISIHFNVGAGGALVLHQGSTVRPEFVARSIDFARRYLQTVTAALNASGLLPSPLGLWGGDGLHDDVMMYRPAWLGAALAGVPLRYGALQGRGYLPRYVEIVLAYGGQPRS